MLRDERGLGTVESVVIVVLVVAFCVAAWNVFGSSVGCRLAGATRAFDDPSQRGLAQCGDEAASAGGAFVEASAGGAAGSSEGQSGADQRAGAPAAPFAEATQAGATSDTAATAGAPDDTASGAGTDAAGSGAGAAQAASSGGGADGAGTSERSVGSRVVDALVSTGETAVDFVEGVIAGANPLTPLLPVRPKPTFGHEIAYGVGETVGAAGGLLYDGGQIISGGSGVVASGVALAGTGGAALPVAGPVLVASGAQVVAGSAASVGHIANLKDGINYAMNGSEPPPRPAESGGRTGAGAHDKPPARDTPASTRRPEAHAETGSSSAQRGSGAHTPASSSASGAAAAGGVANWKSVKSFQHTFLKHGEGAKTTRRLTDTARSTGKPQGQWLNNRAAADLLQSHKAAGLDAPVSVPIPSGMGQVIMPDGSIVGASRATLVPGPNGFVTAYPIP